ncbi:MAG: hypothetical protein L3J45_04785 [Flavobacteriaceae bacterium]|nr:hypothetical protein [Flavobacteriaceae bacterium]
MNLITIKMIDIKNYKSKKKAILIIGLLILTVIFLNMYLLIVIFKSSGMQSISN